MAQLELKLTTIHLLPSSSFLGGFFVRKLSGFGFLVGPLGDVPLVEDELLLRSGTTAVVRKDGFLCVICDASTFLRPDVMAAPLFRSAKTAPISAAGAFFAPGAGGRPGGGGGGGGGGAPPDGGNGGAGGPEDADLVAGFEASARASFASTPCGFQATPLV